MTTRRYPRDTCAGARCGAPILWAITPAGRAMPVDYDPVAAEGGGGSIHLVDQGPGQRPRAEVFLVGQMSLPLDDRPVYRAHFATCPAVATFRNRSRPLTHTRRYRR